MAISISFNGATIYKPSSYSRTTIDLGGGFPLSPTGLVGIIGEAEGGAPGSSDVISDNFFGGDGLADIRNKYVRGPIVDAAAFLFSPAADAAIPGGASFVYIYKTNASVRAGFDPIEAGTTDFGRLRARQWGTSGNKITWKNTLTTETAPAVTGSAAPTSLIISGANDAITFRFNGGAELTATIANATYGSAALLAAAIQTALDAATSGTNDVVASVSSGAIKLTLGATAAVSGVNHHRNGWGRSLEITGGDGIANLNISAGLSVAADEIMAALRIYDNGSLVEETETVGGNNILSIGYYGSAATAYVSVNASTIVFTATGVGADSFTINKSDYPLLSELVAFVNSKSNWSAAVANAEFNNVLVEDLDRAQSVGAKGLSSSIRPARLKNDASYVANFFANSSFVEMIPLTGQTEVKKLGLPDSQTEAYLSGGVKGASANADVTAGLAEFEKVRLNAVIPLFSRDASADLADSLTDSGSSYTIDGIHQAVKTHLSLVASTKKKSERQGYLSYKSSFADAKTKAGNLSDHRIQLMIQDVKQADSEGNIKWFQPWAGACLLAGARMGSPIGTPMTAKNLNCSGIRHTAQAMSTADADIVIDFDPDSDSDAAIIANITFLERPQTGGFRVVVDNTTYGKNSSWWHNRGSTIYASDVLVYDFRSQMEQIFVGVKNNISEAEVRSTADTILRGYLGQGITVPRTDAPNGFKDLSIKINGNIINVSVTCVMVESIDYIISDFFLTRRQ